MAVYVRPLTADEEATLQKLAGSDGHNPSLGQRARIILMSRQGWHVPQIARQLKVHHHTVRKYVHRFNAEGMSALQDRPGRGRAPVYGAEERSKIIAIAQQPPTAFGLPYERWTLSTLQEQLRRSAVSTNIGRETIRRILRDNALTTGRDRSST